MTIILLSILVGGIILVLFNMFKYIMRMTPPENKGETIGCAIWVFLMVFTVIGSFIAAIISNFNK